MNRFTKELWDGCPIEEWSHFVELDGNETKVLGEGWAHPVVVGGVIDRLAAYEDIGLSPEEITDMIYRFEAFLCEMTGNRMSKSNYTLDAMISAANDYQQSLCDGCWDRSELAKYYELEHEKQLVVLPCKVGTVVYAHSSVAGYDSIISGIVQYFVVHEQFIDLFVLFKPNPNEDKHDFAEYIRADKIGKTVFLTREAAEKALGVAGE